MTLERPAGCRYDAFKAVDERQHMSRNVGRYTLCLRMSPDLLAFLPCRLGQARSWRLSMRAGNTLSDGGPTPQGFAVQWSAIASILCRTLFHFGWLQGVAFKSSQIVSSAVASSLTNLVALTD
jgi:hypothetical protein